MVLNESLEEHKERKRVMEVSQFGSDMDDVEGKEH